jgi:hypothetical protein
MYVAMKVLVSRRFERYNHTYHVELNYGSIDILVQILTHIAFE